MNVKRHPLSVSAGFLPAISLTLLVAAPALGQNHWVPFGENGATFAKTGESWQELGSGRELPLSPKARIDQAVAGAGSWWLTAVEPADGPDRLWILRGDGEDIEALPSPTLEESEILLQPKLVVGEAGPEALVWIEGPSPEKSRVRSARWSAGGWAQPVTVAPPGPGTQIALQVTDLADGSYLAAWSAFDGKDDEIVWSRFDGEAWSEPAPVSANEVPDVTPALRATDDGALLVWSAYDGNDYRLYTAIFDGKSWTEGRRFGDRGSVFPTFAAGESRVVVFQQSSPRSWAIAELAPDASVLRKTTVPYRSDRPQVVGKDARGARLLWVEAGPEKTRPRIEPAAWELSVD